MSLNLKFSDLKVISYSKLSPFFIFFFIPWFRAKNNLLDIDFLLVKTNPPSPDVIDFVGCKEKIHMSLCLQDPTLINFSLILYLDPKA